MKEKTPAVTREAAEEFTKNLSQIMGGGYQQILWADKQGIPKALGLELPEWVQRIGGYVRYSIEDRQKIVSELRANGEKISTIARVLGIVPSTVHVSKDQAHRETENLRKRNKRKETSERNRPDPDSDSPNRTLTLTSAQVEAELQSHADQGMEAIVWEKVKDRFIPVWIEMIQSLDESERPHLIWALDRYADKIPV